MSVEDSTILDRFIAKTRKLPSGCILWTGGRVSMGYGTIRANSRQSLAHRVSYELFIGDVPRGLVVCHSCDKKDFVNPLHLFIGTQQENIDDKVQKKRQAVGERHGMSKLTEDDVRTIRRRHASGESYRDIAPDYKINFAHVGSIVTRKTWRGVV